MNREIKFRFWLNGGADNEFKHTMIYDLDVTSSLTINGLFKSVNEWGYAMQYTGRKDKNSVEIYEGSIIECTFNWKGKINTYVGKIIFDEYMFMVDCVGGDLFSLNRVGNINVIGNIHENPELLKQG